RWIVAGGDRDLARQIAEECDVDALVALILVSRGLSDPFEVEEFLSDDVPLGDPMELKDMDKAVDRIERALAQGEKLCVYGDYDADGITATVMLYTYLKRRGADVRWRVPEREENYGLNLAAVDEMAAAGVTLMITVDNGISAAAEIAYAAEKGIDTVVTDHHLPQGYLPVCAAVVDPHRADCPSEFKGYAGAGVCFKLLCALEGVAGEELCPAYADLAAVGTVADVMPLTGENRILVRRGLERLEGARPGFPAILEAGGLRKRPLSASSISFGIAPRLNAAGRVGSCARAVRLLLAETREEADAIAADISESNAKRQTLEREIADQAVRLIEAQGLDKDRVIVVYGEGWYHGVIGIVASRICERYGRPAIILTDEGEMAAGSARSVGDFSLYEAIADSAALLDRFGGHAQAAGLSLPRERVDEFRRAINDYAARVWGDMPFAPLTIDCKLRPGAFTPDMVRSLETLAPFGTGNPTPVFGLFGMTLDRATPVGSTNQHLRLELSREGAAATVMLFGCSAEEFGYRSGDRLDLAVTAELSEYGGREQVTLSAKGVRAADTDEEALLQDIRLYERWARRESVAGFEDRCRLTREDVAPVWRAVKGGFSGQWEALLARLPGLNYIKMRLALDALAELGL
ncbi:MAG: single-stranded-DNA-specific exonuclease RecJ, partial [Clostridia bacterium]|nr:single-stranded-DNA-specific exonuclease RecJ [Clostridia bacterium]